MKKIFSILMLLSLVVVSACRKSDNATMPDGMVYLNQPHITKISGSPAILDDDPMSFEAKIGIDLYFKDSDKKPDYLDFVVMKNGDAKNVKTLKGNITSYPDEFDVSGQLLTDLFGTIVAGDSYDFGVNYITGGATYLAFPEVGDGYGANVGSQPDASPTARYSAICSYIADDFIGDGKFKVVTDGWADFGVGSIADVVKVDESTIAITYPIDGFNPITIDINLGDNTASVARQPLGTYGGSWQYGTLYVASTGGGNANYVDPCSGRIRINGSYTVSAGGFGAFVLELEKAQ
ncbi:hypothetical protein [Sphingobacterium haloxyli]|uniref:SusE outer membrane protein domain-containing protein n=1 Tax=Sphingobacterium haloxyli TaxID=2100533 RepID=A0A2S9J0Z8_9SPHI|nr:hypothetical protein [Sphingobacterium haloxyli]PRD46439.1 hypothetical protein C5745_15855 [Sphingobacterium haloxyli]